MDASGTKPISGEVAITASMRLMRKRVSSVCARCAAEVNTSLSGMRMTSRRKMPASMSSLRRACHTRNGSPGGSFHRLQMSRMRICGVVSETVEPTAAMRSDAAWQGTTRSSVLLMPE